VLILKADSLGERVDRIRRAREEMPAGCGVGTPVTFDVVGLLGRGHIRSFAGIKADGDYVELVTHIKLHQAHRTRKSGQSFAAQHGAVVINTVEDPGLAPEVISELHSLACIVAEDKIWRNLRV